MADYMKEHPNLAKNIIPNCSQGKATSTRLWEQLKIKLNAVGPPTKEAKVWRKVFADQKYQVKKKLSYNKESKRKTGGGPYEEKILTQAEELIIEASGLEVAVEGIKNVKTFGNASSTAMPTSSIPKASMQATSIPTSSPITTIFDEVAEFIESDDSTNLFQSDFNSADKHNKENQAAEKPQKNNKSVNDPKLLLLQENIKAGSDFQKEMGSKLDRLLEIQERLLEIKEEKHRALQEQNIIELQIKKI